MKGEVRLFHSPAIEDWVEFAILDPITSANTDLQRNEGLRRGEGGGRGGGGGVVW